MRKRETLKKEEAYYDVMSLLQSWKSLIRVLSIKWKGGRAARSSFLVDSRTRAPVAVPEAGSVACFLTLQADKGKVPRDTTTKIRWHCMSLPR